MDRFNLVIPAAGAATRLRPLSSNTSKIMVRVNGKPTLDYIIEAVNGSVDEVVIIDGKFTDIREYCEVKHPNIEFANQPSFDGPRDAIKIGMNALKDPSKPVVVWLGDAIILEKDMPLGTDFLLTKIVDDHKNWCMWDGLDYYNKPDKPIPNGTALVGLYSFKDGVRARDAFCESTDSDISGALKIYGEFNNVTTNLWYDIGDLPRYFKTCAALLNTKARAFNNLHFDADLGTIRKGPDYHNEHSIKTLRDEKAWYDTLTPEQSLFTPRILPHKVDLIMSYESGTLLSDIMLYENMPDSHWDYIMDRIFQIKLKYFNNRIQNVGNIDSFSGLSRKMWIDKTEERLSRIGGFPKGIKIKLLDWAYEVHKHTAPITGMHGDLHFANILYNQQTDQFKLLDPRGNYGGKVGTIGDDIYDWAKLAHDCYYGYNAAVADVPHNKYVKELFVRKLDEYDLPKDIILKGGLLLVATCIPLHYDDSERQTRFLQKVLNEMG